MGIGTIGPMDINFPHTKAEFPINAVAEDIISGVLADFVADSLQLYYDPQYELGFESFCDALTPGNGAVPCFVDSAKGRVMGVHKESSNGTRCVFLGFDQLSLNTQALAGYTITAGYHRVENNVFSVVGAALRWFGLDQADVKDNLAPVISTTYVLHQNHPNPFNPQTIITYNLAEACFVRLVVYNVLGQKVAVLVNEYKSANSYKVNFNANNLTSGVYFYRLNAGDYSVTKKMMLLP